MGNESVNQATFRQAPLKYPVPVASYSKRYIIWTKVLQTAEKNEAGQRRAYRQRGELAIIQDFHVLTLLLVQ